MKEKYLKQLKTLNIKPQIMVPLENFIMSYDGTNELEFLHLLLALMKAFEEYKVYEIKAQGYDELLQTKKEFEDTYARLSDELAAEGIEATADIYEPHS